MGSKKCDLTTKLFEQLKINHLSGEMKDHLKKCKDCSDEYNVISWMKSYSDTSPAGSDPKVPSFNSLWSQAFREKRVEPDLIKKAMLPMKIAGLFARGAVILFVIISAVLYKTAIFTVGKQFDHIGKAGQSLLSPFIRMFNSSVFVSIPLTIIFASILLYLLFSIFNSINKRSFGSV